VAIQLYQLFAQEYKNFVGLQSIARGEQQQGEISATQAQWLALSSNDRIKLQSIYEDQWIIECCTLIAEMCQLNYTPDRYIRVVGEDRTIGTAQITNKEKSVKYDIDILPATRQEVRKASQSL
jgi:hypothetical protein